ncbi:MAG: T9SS type A sorting domain-containing protein [Bacteroidota bacterium]
MKKSFWILLFSLLLPRAVQAQTGTCEPALGEAYLDAGNVRARILNNGGLFWRGSPHVYEIDGTDAIFAAGIWIGGMINDTLHTAASRYGPWEFWAGPLDDLGNPPADCSIYDQIWEIRTKDFQLYFETDSISTNLQNWPWQLGAPVVDGDGNPNNYNLQGGDLPELLGDQRLWWIMNDRGNIHEATNTAPLGIEVHATAFAFANPTTLGNITFYEYNIINKNSAPITETYVGLFSDVDLGNFDDDFVGSDSLNHLGFAYNSDNFDEGGEGYGNAPPAIGFTFTETLLADDDGLDNNRDGSIDEAGEMLGVTSMMNYYGGGGVNGDPQHGPDYYNLMKALHKDDMPILLGYRGYPHRNSVPPDFPRETTRFFFPGDPVTKAFWSEFNLDNQGTAENPADRRFVTSTGPFTIARGDTVTIRPAIIWSRGNDHLDSITVLRKDTRAVRRASTSLYASRTPQSIPTPEIPEKGFVLGFDQNFPNPFSESTTIQYSLPQSMQVKLAIYNVLGQEISVLVNTRQEAGIYSVDFEAKNLPAGVYFAKAQFDFLQFTKRMLIIR